MSPLLPVALAAVLLPAALAAGSWPDLSKVKHGSKLVVTTKEGRAVEGKFETASDSAISVYAMGVSTGIARADVRRVSQRKRKSMKRSILAGAAIGAGAGAALGAAAGGCRPHDFICFGRAVTVPITAAAGGINGVIFGTILGLLRHETAVLFESP